MLRNSTSAEKLGKIADRRFGTLIAASDLGAGVRDPKMACTDLFRGV